MKKEGNIYSYTAFERFNNSYSSAQIERWYVNTFSFYRYLLYVFRKRKDTILPQDMNFTYNHKFSVSHEIKKSSDGKYFAVMENKAVTIWDCVTGKKIASFEELKMPDTMNFSNSGKLLAVKSESGKIAIYDMTEMKFINSWLPSKSIGCEVLFTPDDKYVVSADWKGNIYTIDIESGEIAIIRDDLFGNYDSLKFYRETNEFIFEEEERRLIWKYPFEENEPVERKHNYRFEETAYSEVNKCYAITTICMNKKLLIVDKDYKQIIKEITVPNVKAGKARILNAAWSPDGKLFALAVNTGERYSGSRIYTTQLMEYPSLRVIKEYKIPYAYFAEFTDDGKQLLIGGFEKGYCIDLDSSDIKLNTNKLKLTSSWCNEKKVSIKKINNMKMPDLLKEDIDFCIYVNQQLFFQEDYFCILEFIRTFNEWIVSEENVNMEYNSIETEDNPLIYIYQSNDKFKIHSPWQLFSFSGGFTKLEIARAYNEFKDMCNLK